MNVTEPYCGHRITPYSSIIRVSVMAQPNQPKPSDFKPTPKPDLYPNSEFEYENEDGPIVKNKAKVEKPIEYKVYNDVPLLFEDAGDEDYPYDKMKVDEAFFVPTQPNDTTDKLLVKIHKSVELAKQRYGEIEVNEDGDEILEVLTVKTRQRNSDGTIKLTNGKPVLGADYYQRPKYIYTRNFIAKAVTKGQELADGVEAEGDGVVVVRVA